MIRTAFAIALILASFSLPLAMAASLGGSQQNIEEIVRPNFAPIDLPVRR
jgi:hypothetical protein